MIRSFYPPMCLIGIIVALFLAFPGTSTAQKVAGGYSALSSLIAPFWVIKEAGFFNQEGLDGLTERISPSSTGFHREKMIACLSLRRTWFVLRLI
jgi:ABC-type nitrate/sulfonate/bicarbonate transport system substrate-binding protein